MALKDEFDLHFFLSQYSKSILLKFQFSTREDFVDTKNEIIAHVKRNIAAIMNIPSHDLSRRIPATFEPAKAPILPNKRVVDIAIDL